MLLLLDKIALETPIKLTGESLVLAELVLPRNAIARRSVLKPVQLNRGKRSLARAGFVQQALLKERVEGLFGLRVAVTRPLGQRELAATLRRLLAAGIEEFGSELARRVPFGPAGELVDAFGEELADQITDDAPDFIAQGSVDLDSESLVPGKLAIPLSLIESIRSSAHLKLSEKRAKRQSAAKTLRKGMAVGELVVEMVPE